MTILDEGINGNNENNICCICGFVIFFAGMLLTLSSATMHYYPVPDTLVLHGTGHWKFCQIWSSFPFPCGEKHAIF
jgi:hypothetical protein